MMSTITQGIPKRSGSRVLLWAVAVVAVCGFAAATQAAISGLTGPNFSLATRDGYISTADGGSVYMWGYAQSGGLMQFPGPTLIVEQGQLVTVTLENTLTVPASILFPGQEGVEAIGGSPGLLTQEAAASGGTVTYRFVASRPGTYTYYSGTSPELQVEMGLVGALIVRPQGQPTWAYSHPDTAFDHEYLFVLSDMDVDVHNKTEFGQAVDNTKWWPVYWFINGRTGPDTMAADGVPWLPHQPYSCLPRMHPEEVVLLRVIGTGHDAHPYHTHGNNHLLIARNARLLESAPGAGPDIAESNFTLSVHPGETYDALFTWTAYGLGWDVYGHTLGVINPDANKALQSHELYAQSALATPLASGDTTTTLPAGEGRKYPYGFRAILWDPAFPTPDHDPNREVVVLSHAGTSDTFTILRAQEGTAAQNWAAGTILAHTDHGVPIPVVLPAQQSLTFGMFYSGSPNLGSAGALPPGDGGFNANGGLYFMWHSHNEREIVNFDLFPGGMLTMAVVEPPGVAIP